MSQSDLAATLTPGQVARRSPPRAFRLLPALENNARVVAFAQTLPGRATLAASFAALAVLVHKPAAVAATMVVLFPARRRLLVGLASVGMVVVTSRLQELLKVLGQEEGLTTLAHHRALKPAVLLVALGLLIAYVQLAKTRLPGLLLRWPVATLLAINTGLLGLASILPLEGASRLITWAVIGGAGSYIWYVAYSLKDRVDRCGFSLLKDASAWRPFWGGTSVPFPKAGALLQKLEVRTPDEAAVWQLKALKLITWALLLALLRTALVLVATGSPAHPSAWLPDTVLPLTAQMSFGMSFQVPSLQNAFALAMAGTPHSAAVNWAALALHLAVDLLDISIFGHVAVAGARMAGFKALRNTHRPLESRSIADFWNRYYFYFKELLVDFFFVPTYLRWFKKYPRLRLFFATFAAAGFGNFLFHWLAEPVDVVTHGFWGSIVARQTYAFYACLLVLGIAWSQLRKPSAPKSSPWARVATTAGVLLFYALLQVPNSAPAGSSVSDCLRFFACLFPQL